jgi:phosphocarrier protein
MAARSGDDVPVVEKTFRIVNQLGLHARAATRLVQTASRYQSMVEVEKDGQVANGKSIMGVLMLVAAQGSLVTVRCKGNDASTAVDAIGDLIADRFGETQ